MINFQANLHTFLVSCLINLGSLSLPLIQLACPWFEKSIVSYSGYRSSQNVLDERGHSTIPLNRHPSASELCHDVEIFMTL